MSKTILVVEDELALRETLVYNLTREGYQVEDIGDGRTAVEMARSIKPALIILDIMLPGMDGFDVTRILRKEMNIPILMLTAKDGEIDRVLGLEIGADDYVTKPFSMRELLARVKAMLRRDEMIRENVAVETGEGSHKDVMVFGDLTINISRHEVICGEEILSLKPKEYELLLYLAKHRGQVLTRDLILEEVWGWDFSGGTRTVDVHIRWLRAKIEPEPRDPKRIVTVRGTGYRFDG
ncbi:MAG: response regulator transcription factor [Anaerolineales bacterium]|jgi:DNA-binding response OmpR family regulator